MLIDDIPVVDGIKNVQNGVSLIEIPILIAIKIFSATYVTLSGAEAIITANVKKKKNFY